jgi:hypothetical protein
MSYNVEMIEVATGNRRTRRMNVEWGEGSDCWWSEGNFSCDCNRSGLFFGDEHTEDIRCGEDRFAVRCMADDGTELYRDKHFTEETP